VQRKSWLIHGGALINGPSQWTERADES